MSLPRDFSFWWKGAPLTETGDGRKFNLWWKGSPVLQSSGAPNVYVVVASGGISIGGAASTRATFSSVAAGGVTIGGSATANRDFVLTGSGGITIGGAATTVVNFQTLPDTIKTGTYTGDGTSSQAVDFGYLPIAVMVIGLDGSSKEIGAIRTRDMAAGKSHPYENDISTASSKRDNRITAFTATGFTVGADLNASGQPYFWIAFPAIAGSVAIGSYTGDGGDSIASAVTLTISGTAASALSAFSSGDVGKTLYRVSDNAAIGTITVFINANNVTITGGIDGTYASANWYAVGRKVSLGLVPDAVILFEDSTITVNTPTPLLMSAGFIGDTVGANGVDQDLETNGLNPAYAATYTGTNYIQLANFGPSDAIYNKSGVTYYWLALKALASSAYFDKIDYTGDGTSSRDLSGLSFIPEFMLTISKNRAAKAFAVSAVFPSSQDLPVSDGASLESGTVTLQSGGAHLGANVLNENARAYRALFFAPSFATIGGITIGGAATTQQLSIKITMTGSGGITIGGVANLVINLVVSPSGGVTIGGTSPFDIAYSPTASGGITIGGEATTHPVHAITGSGGVTIGGAADFVINVVVDATGGVTIGGAADANMRFTVTASGGIVIGGAADFVINVIVDATGGITIGGQAEVVTNTPVTYTVVGSGGITVGGEAVIVLNFVVSPTGGIVLGGTSPFDVIYNPVESGGIEIGGVAGVVYKPITPPVPPRPTPIQQERGGGAVFAKSPMWRVPVCEGRAELLGVAGHAEAAGTVIDKGVEGEMNQLLSIL